LEAFDSLVSSYDLDEVAKRCVLADCFRLTHFKDFQLEVINAVLNKGDALVIQPTGSGKSLCFQFPAVYCKAITLVITPTISLMQDQTTELDKRGIPATFLGSAQLDPNAESRALADNTDILLLFVSPEWLFAQDDRNLTKIQALNTKKRIGLVAIDEAHLVYDWQDFRSTYKRCEELHDLLPGVPIMALSATVTVEVENALKAFLKDPLISRSTVNRVNIYLAAESCNYKRKDGSKQSISLDARDFNSFADRVKQIIGSQCTIVYTDFACHVGPIVIALRDRDIKAIGYYGKMKEIDKQDSYRKWKNDEVQAIVATRAFGLGINKPDVKFVIRNGLPPSMSAWAQEYGRAGRDGKQAHAYILYSDNDIQHVGYWARDMARQHRSSDISNSAQQFSLALPFSYAHLAGICRRTILLELFGEDSKEIVRPEHCCDVCEMPSIIQGERKSELALLIQAIDELKTLGEVKVTEWIRGGEIAWMQQISRCESSAYGKSPPRLSKEWWRMFIRQVSAAGFIFRSVKPAAFGTSIQGAYALLQPTSKGRNAIAEGDPVLLPDCADLQQLVTCTTSSGKSSSKQRTGKGKHILPIVKRLLSEEENWLELTSGNKERYLFPGWHSSCEGNVLYFTDNVTALPQQSGEHHLWQDIQFGKTSTSKSKMSITLNGKMENLNYWIAQCNGVKKCTECDHVLPNVFTKNNCSVHPGAALEVTGSCAVEFIYIFPVDTADKRRWIGGIIRSDTVIPCISLHNHPVDLSLSHKLSKMVSSGIKKSVNDNPYLTTRQLASGQGLGYRPGLADMAGTSYERINYHKNKALKESGIVMKGVHVITDMEAIANKIDEKDCAQEGSTIVSKQYQEIGRPYMVDYSITASMTYQFIMSPLMCKLLSEAEFVETDTTYGENTELTYLFNATVFDVATMKWAVVARMRANRESAEFYKVAFSIMFRVCSDKYPSFEVGKSLKGIIMDWSDAESKGLREAVGDEIASNVLRGCNVHWTRSYQRVAERVNSRTKDKTAADAFCKVAKCITEVSQKQDIYKLFDVLQGTANLSTIQHINTQLTEDQKKISTLQWKDAKHWVQWWIRPNHLQMLCKPFSSMSSSDWDKGPRNTNGVERANGLAKTCDRKISLYGAMQSLYEKDKMFVLQYIAATDGLKISYRSSADLAQRSASALKRKATQAIIKDTDCSFGPPDKKQHFVAKTKKPNEKAKSSVATNAKDPAQRSGTGKLKESVADDVIDEQRKEVEVLYADGKWYRGWLSSFNFATGKWKVQFYDDDETTEVTFPDKDVRLVL